MQPTVGRLAAAAALLAACASGGGTPDRGRSEVLVGEVSREQIEAAAPAWVAAAGASEPDADAARDLVAALPGAELTVFLGTWCSDSEREVSRFWRALDLAAPAVPGAVRYVAVDRTKRQPARLVAGTALRFVPTFVLRRDGREVGRVVEESPAGIERDLLALARGEARGILTASRPELLGEPR